MWVVIDTYSGCDLNEFGSKKAALLWADDECEALREIGEDDTNIRVIKRRVSE